MSNDKVYFRCTYCWHWVYKEWLRGGKCPDCSMAWYDPMLAGAYKKWEKLVRDGQPVKVHRNSCGQYHWEYDIKDNHVTLYHRDNGCSTIR